MASGLGLLNLILALLFQQTAWPAAVWPTATLAPRDGAPLVEISAARSTVLVPSENVYLFRQRAEETQPMASITKLMTAVVFLENNPGWEKTYRITPEDQLAGGRLNLFSGDELKIKDLLYTSLVASDNGATIALVHASGLSEEEFVVKMNAKARQIGLRQTRFADPTGLDDQNVSTARDVARLAEVAFSFPDIREAIQLREYRFSTVGGKEKLIESTDYLLFDEADNPFQVLGGKTGYTNRAGYCFVGLFEDAGGREIISVVLNSSGKNERFKESKALVNWVFANYSW